MLLRKWCALGVVLAAGVVAVPAVPAHGAQWQDEFQAALTSGRPVTSSLAASAARRWLVTATPGRASRRIARRYRAKRRSYAPVAVYSVRRKYVQRMVWALKRKNVYVNHEPDNTAGGTQVTADDPLDASSPWRPLIVAPSLAPPPVTPSSPLLAIVDDALDLSHPEFVGSSTRALGRVAPRTSHGIATAAIAGAPDNNVGITGVWPGMRVLNVPLPNARYACSDRVEAISSAIQAGADVISLEYGGRRRCFGEYVMVQLAIARQIIVVAGAGNTFARGNHAEFPARLPHVVTVAAVAPDLSRAPFSTAHSGVDLSAPGVDVLTAVRPGDANDVDGDGYATVSGTSFAAPMVAAAAAWVRATRPALGRSEIVLALLTSARDVASPGWDAGTGYGVLDIAAALGEHVPHNDPLEPNDDIPWIDGTIFGKPDPSVGQRGTDEAFPASTDEDEDPGDVYRIRLRSGESARVTVTPAFGDPDIAAYAPGARSIHHRRSRIAQSRRGGEAIERLMLRNRGRRARTYFVAVTPSSLNTTYLMRLQRLGSG